MNMVEIECPHCDEDIELDDDDFGLFKCPHCEDEFSWDNDDEDDEVETFQKPGMTGKLLLGIIVKWGCYLSGALLAVAIISGIIVILTDGGLMILFSIWIAMAAGYVLLATLAIGVIGVLIGLLVKKIDQ